MTCVDICDIVDGSVARGLGRFYEAISLRCRRSPSRTTRSAAHPAARQSILSAVDSVRGGSAAVGCRWKAVGPGWIVDGNAVGAAVDEYLRRSGHEHACSLPYVDDEQVEERQRHRSHEGAHAPALLVAE